MSTTNITYAADTDIRRRITNALRNLRDSRDELRDIIAVLQTGISGDSSTSDQFTRTTVIGGYVDNDNALASWGELNSVYAKLITPGGQSAADVGPAISQACAKHGV